MALKLSLSTTAQHKIARKVFPRMKLFYNTRHPLKSMVSYKHIFQSPAVGILIKYQGTDYFCYTYPFDHESKECETLRRRLIRDRHSISTVSSYAYSYGASVDYYLRHKDLYLHCVLYENLIDDPEGETTRLFDALGISRDLVPRALTAMRRHSQQEFFGDRDDGKNGLTAQDMRDIEQAFKDMKLPFTLDTPVEEFKALF